MFLLAQRHEVHVKNNVVLFNSCWNQQMKLWLVDINLAILKTWDQAQHSAIIHGPMVYTKVDLSIDMDWSTILMNMSTKEIKKFLKNFMVDQNLPQPP